MFFLRSHIKNLRPVVGPVGRKFFYDPKVDSDIYMKGAWILHSLRTYLKNDTLFFDIFKSFATKFKFSIATSKDFINLVSEKSGDNMQWFFDQYLNNRFVPVLEIALTRKGLFYRWTHTNNDFRMPVKIKLGNDNEIEITPTVKTQFFSWAFPRVNINFRQSLFLVKENSALPFLYNK